MLEIEAAKLFWDFDPTQWLRQRSASPAHKRQFTGWVIGSRLRPGTLSTRSDGLLGIMRESNIEHPSGDTSTHVLGLMYRDGL